MSKLWRSAWWRNSRRWLSPCLVAALALALVATVQAERERKGGLEVFLNGGIQPLLLPRDRLAPVGVRLDAGIRSADGKPLPRVREVKLELAWRGTLATRGLPVCPKRRLRSLNSRAALGVCGGALVGRGRLYSRIFLPNQPPFGMHSHLLAFNGKTKGGQPAVWVLAYSSDPPVSVVIPFHVRHQPGQFHTVLVSVVPRSVGPWPHFARFHMFVSRRFAYRGRVHSYLDASCPLPPRLSVAFLSLARVTFVLAGGGPDLQVETVRSCRAR